MSPRTSLAMAAAVAALGAFVWFYELGGEAGRSAAEEASKRILPGFESEAVEWLALQTSDGHSARAERHEGVWRIVEPVDFPADAVALDGIASTLEQLVHERHIEAAQALSVYGLGDAARTLRFAVGGEERALRIGRTTPVGANTYVARGSDDAVYTAPTWRLNSLDKALDELRDRRVLPFEQSAAVRFEAEWPGGGVSLERRGEDWFLIEPIEEAAYPETVRSLLSDLSYLRADGFVDAVPADEDVGLAPPDFALDLHLESDEGEASVLRFELGAVRDGRRLARGTEQAGSALYVVTSGRIDDFPRELARYRDRRLASFVVSDVTSIELEFAAEGASTTRVVLRHAEGSWSSEPPLRDGLAGRIASRLAALDATGIDADRMGPDELAALGLAPPRIALRVLGGDDEQGTPALLAQVDLGNVDSRRGIAARRAGRELVFRVAADVAEDLPVSWEAFESRFAEVPVAAEDSAAAAADEASPDL